MELHHLAWLESHPHRSAEWLSKALLDGFDVHHVDGDRSNNAPSNLIMLEHADHMRLHGVFGGIGRLAPSKAIGRQGKESAPKAKRRRPVTKKAKARALAAYEAARQALNAEVRAFQQRKPRNLL